MIQIYGILGSKVLPQHQEPFQLLELATLGGAQLSLEEKKKVQISFDRDDQVFSRGQLTKDFLIESFTNGIEP